MTGFGGAAFCSQCGAPQNEDARFCSGCGARTAPPGHSLEQTYETRPVPQPTAPRPIAPPAPPPPAAYYAPPQVHVTQQVQVAPLLLAPPKSVALAVVLTFFFGPLGLFYSSVVGGVVMLLVSLIAAGATFGIGLLFTWPACMIWGAIAAANYNSALAMRSQNMTQTNRY